MAEWAIVVAMLALVVNGFTIYYTRRLRRAAQRRKGY